MKAAIKNLVLREIGAAFAALPKPFERGGSRTTFVASERVIAIDIQFKTGDDSFAFEVFWPFPDRHQPVEAYPELLVGRSSGRFRADLLWSTGGQWFAFEKPTSIVSKRSIREIIRQSASGIGEADAKLQMPRVRSDVEAKLSQYVLPWIARHERSRGRLS